MKSLFIGGRFTDVNILHLRVQLSPIRHIASTEVLVLLHAAFALMEKRPRPGPPEGRRACWTMS